MNEVGKILVVDDDPGVRFFLEEILSRDGHQVVAVASGEAALECVSTQMFDLALVDLVMRGMDGMTLVKALHTQAPETSIVVLTAHASVETAVAALRQGAHDYLFKPCSSARLRASIQSGLLKRQRRLSGSTQVEPDSPRALDGQAAVASADFAPVKREYSTENQEVEMTHVLKCAGLVVDSMRHEARLDGIVIELSPTEFGLLCYLMEESPRVVSPLELVREIQGYDCEPWEARDTMRYHVYRIRRKIEKSTGQTGIVRTVRGVGYTIS